MKDLCKYGELSVQFNITCPISMHSSSNVLQDPDHKNNNLKNRLCDQGIVMFMGAHRVTINHLENLIDNVPKNLHLLTKYDVSNKDKMNHRVIQKFASRAVLNLLKEKDRGTSDGTIQYLKMLKLLSDAFVKVDTPATTRLFNAFYCLLFFRIWQYHCLNSEDLNLDNFITPQSYQSIEINAWTLLKLIVLCRDEIGEEFFLIFLMNSQTDEKFFRIMRSLTSTSSTMVNFTPLELLERAQKFQLKEELIHDLKDVFTFRENLVRSVRKDSVLCEKLPSDDMILKTLDEAIRCAKESAQELGIFDCQNQNKAIGFGGVDADTVNSRLSLPSNQIFSHSYNNCTPKLARKDVVPITKTTDNVFSFQNLIFINQHSGNL
jgi:hypothetical protein